MRTAVLLAKLIMLMLLINGCGGRGNDIQPPDSLLENTIRQWQSGDQWEYDISGTATDGVDTVHVTGTYTITMTDLLVTTPKGITANTLMRSMILMASGDSIVSTDRIFITQDTNGTIRQHGREDADDMYWVVVPEDGSFVAWTSPMAIGISWGSKVILSNGKEAEHDISNVITGTAIISVPAGSFEAYQVTGDDVQPRQSISFREWFAPQIGSFVQRELMSTDFETGLTLELTISLSARTRQSGITLTSPTQTDLREWLVNQFEVKQDINSN